MPQYVNPPIFSPATQPVMAVPLPQATQVIGGLPVLTNPARPAPAFFDLLNQRGYGHAS